MKQAGISALGMMRFTTGYLPNIIHQDEHIKAAVYGRRREGTTFLDFEVGLLVATDERVLYVVHRPGYTTTDEVSYGLISGVSISTAGPFATITLYTKITNYVMSFARPKAAQHFADTIEQLSVIPATEKLESSLHHKEPTESNDATSFLQSHDIGVISTLDRNGTINSAVVYYTLLNNRPYFITKTATKKMTNLLGDQHIALTVYDEAAQQTVQMQGIAKIESEESIIQQVSNTLIRPRSYQNSVTMPPATKLGGGIVVVRIAPIAVNFTDYSKL